MHAAASRHGGRVTESVWTLWYELNLPQNLALSSHLKMVWGVPAAAATSWADDEPEEEHKAAPAPAPKGPDPDAFPSLGEAVKQQPKKKKDKGQTLNLSAFLAGAPARTTVGPRGPSDKDILAQLPQGPRGDRGDDGDDGGGMGGFSGFSRGGELAMATCALTIVRACNRFI